MEQKAKTAAKGGGLKKLLKQQEVIVILLIILVSIFLSIRRPDSFPTSLNIFNVLKQASQYAVLAIGMGFVIICGNIDISVGAIIATSICTAAYVNEKLGVINPLFVLLIIFAVGALFGLINGLLITKLDLIPFIASLGGQWVYRGALKLLNNGATITLRGTISDEALTTLTYIGNGKFLGIPVPVYLVLVMAIALNFVLRHTVFGRSVYAVGSNAETA